MTKEDAIALLRFARAANKVQYGFIEERSAYEDMAIMFAADAGMTKDEIFSFLRKEISAGSATQIVEKYEKKYDRLFGR